MARGDDRAPESGLRERLGWGSKAAIVSLRERGHGEAPCSTICPGTSCRNPTTSLVIFENTVRGDALRRAEMDVQARIRNYIAGQPQPKRDDLETLHQVALGVSPDCRLWFLDGLNGAGKIISNPSIGYGVQVQRYANGDTREFYQV